MHFFIAIGNQVVDRRFHDEEAADTVLQPETERGVDFQRRTAEGVYLLQDIQRVERFAETVRD